MRWRFKVENRLQQNDNEAAELDTRNDYNAK